MYKVVVSNSTSKNFNLILPKVNENNKTRYMQDFIIPAFALNYELTFNNETDFNEWKKHHASYVEGVDAIIRIGDTNANVLEKVNKEVEKKANKKRQENVNKIADIDKSVGVEVEIEKA